MADLVSPDRKVLAQALHINMVSETRVTEIMDGLECLFLLADEGGRLLLAADEADLDEVGEAVFRATSRRPTGIEVMSVSGRPLPGSDWSSSNPEWSSFQDVAMSEQGTVESGRGSYLRNLVSIMSVSNVYARCLGNFLQALFERQFGVSVLDCSERSLCDFDFKDFEAALVFTAWKRVELITIRYLAFSIFGDEVSLARLAPLVRSTLRTPPLGWLGGRGEGHLLVAVA